MFISTSKWGFPHKVSQIISQYNNGVISIGDTLEKLAKMYSTNIKTYYTYDDNGNKCGHTCIEFGLPIVVRYMFQEVNAL